MRFHHPPRRNPDPGLGLAAQAALGIIWLVALSGCAERADPMIDLSGPTMGTYYSVKIARPPVGLSAETLEPELTRILAEVSAEISTYDPNSELSRLNANPSTDWIPVSEHLLTVMAEGQRLADLTNGVYDVTIGPLVNLWGFGPEPRSDHLPTEAEIQAARERIGYQKLELRDAPPAVRKARGDLYIDLSSLGEGYGVDRIAEWLESRGVTDYMVAIAGTIRAKGFNAKGQPWAIAIEQPLPERRAVHRVIAVSDRAISTSGDYRNFFEKDGKRYSHEIDPMTGTPVDRQLGSVTVIGDVGMIVDGLATALMVLGEKRGPALAEIQGIAAYFILREGETFRGIASSAFQTYLDAAAATPTEH
ncbi:FAD:protein FMN transferase [Thermochromatium tepidum]|uniref:FAD:protein FMN transferase n=1 Tax=Thermochromatium tepidum ATCC 43061 TaxID=316276 RepID=A0A6I6E150_THETI|nr:FAD:protein FMN transferase [Thermochromatium tepidum]QGU32655.1 FAD:protein FMN transferase ApbE [Thermochromatium tepidum ATCC 43061]